MEKYTPQFRWFGKGSNLRGHNQIMSRLEYLGIEKEILSCDEAYYEFRAIEKLIELEPNKTSREFYWKLVKGEK